MAPLKTIAYRLPQELIDRIDAYAKMRARVDRRPCDRSTAIRALLERALVSEGGIILDYLDDNKASETITGKITDGFQLPTPPKKKQPPHRRQDRMPGVAFEGATARADSKKKKKRSKRKR